VNGGRSTEIVGNGYLGVIESLNLSLITYQLRGGRGWEKMRVEQGRSTELKGFPGNVLLFRHVAETRWLVYLLLEA